MKTDIIVVGGGHAGIEAANAAAKSGLSVMLITGNPDLIGQMSCNPAIGGVAKGNIVREIDALGGVMGKVIDCAGIQFRMLNSSKGAAVWGNRAQADKALYRKLCREYLESVENISIYQGMVTGIIVSGRAVSGVELEDGGSVYAPTVILAMGTFLNGLAYIGLVSFACGRIGEPASFGLTESLQGSGIKTGRLKTGTPARIDGRSVDYSFLKEQRGDDNPWPFSFSTTHLISNKAVCWELKTTNKTHDIIREGLDKSPLYSGMIKSIGPRYCPSIEDKVVKFGDRTGHTLFLEPEGLNTHEMYLNGFSTSLPLDIQVAMLQSLPGFDSASIIRPAYAIEYDYFPPTQLYQTLESRVVENLYFAGQINGTSGYEEAGCQGLIAGVNASRKISGKASFVLGRETSYTGVLIDDLVTKGTEEPYRMFTSRAEYRLMLRQDNVDERLMPIALDANLIDLKLIKARQVVWDKRKGLLKKLFDTKISPEMWGERNILTELKQTTSAATLLKRPEVSVFDICDVLDVTPLDKMDMLTIEADVKYEGFLRKQQEDIERKRNYENTIIPEDIDYTQIQGFLSESRQKFLAIRPLTLGQAARISGVTPADITVLMLHLIKKI